MYVVSSCLEDQRLGKYRSKAGEISWQRGCLEFGLNRSSTGNFEPVKEQIEFGEAAFCMEKGVKPTEEEGTLHGISSTSSCRAIYSDGLKSIRSR